MNTFALRPLTLGEILDRTFTLYRQHFLLFIGITGIPQLLVLAASFAETFALPRTGRIGVWPSWPVLAVGGLVLFLGAAVYLFSEGATILAVSNLYLGRAATVSESLRGAWDNIGTLIGVSILNLGAVIGASLLLIIPGIYVACRLMVSVPAALIEQRGPSESFSRSFQLTKGKAWHAFLIVVFGMVLGIAASMLLSVPFQLAAVFSAHDPGMLRLWTSLNLVGSSIASLLTSPISLIALCVFYFDRRVRLEGFDLQFLMDPNSERSSPPTAGSVPSIL
jgi:energy-converting hydrogenase Eha subunit C